MINGNMIGIGSAPLKTLILTDENGNEVTGICVDSAQVFDATVNDVRVGKTFASDEGVQVGEKNILEHHTSEGSKVIPVGSTLRLIMKDYDLYDYTYLQCIICKWDTSISSSLVDTHKVLDSNVYEVGSNVVVTQIIKDVENKAISLGMINTGDVPVVIRYCTYKEME